MEAGGSRRPPRDCRPRSMRSRRRRIPPTPLPILIPTSLLIGIGQGLLIGVGGALLGFWPRAVDRRRTAVQPFPPWVRSWLRAWLRPWFRRCPWRRHGRCPRWRDGRRAPLAEGRDDERAIDRDTGATGGGSAPSQGEGSLCRRCQGAE